MRLRNVADLEVIEYRLAEGVRLCKVGDANLLRSAWAIRQGALCMDRNGKWLYEPRPSNRTAAFLGQTRFDSAGQALDCWQFAWGGEEK